MASYYPDSSVKAVLMTCTNEGKMHIVVKCKYSRMPGEVGITIEVENMLYYKEVDFELRDPNDIQEIFDLISRYARSAEVVVCVYDIASKASYDKIPNLLKLAKKSDNSKAIFFLVGNSQPDFREVKAADGERFATEHGMKFFECECPHLTGKDTRELFYRISEQEISDDGIITTCDESYVVIELNDIIREDSLTSKKKKRGYKRLF